MAAEAAAHNQHHHDRMERSANIFIRLTDRIGAPMAILFCGIFGVFSFMVMAYRSAVWLGENAVVPVVQRHTLFLDTQIQATKDGVKIQADSVSVQARQAAATESLDRRLDSFEANQVGTHERIDKQTQVLEQIKAALEKRP